MLPAARLGAIAGNPTRAEMEAAKEKHKMRKTQHNGKPFWTCAACGYSTSKPSSAEQHEKAPF